jgi:hypothetical protein
VPPKILLAETKDFRFQTSFSAMRKVVAAPRRYFLESHPGLSRVSPWNERPKRKENKMSNKKSGIWSIALPLSVVFLAAVYYVKMPDVRKAVDARTPVVRNLLGRYVQESGVKIVILPGEQDPAFAATKLARESALAKTPATPVPTMRKASEPVPPAVAPMIVPNPAPTTTVPEWHQIASDRTKWPKKVTLTKAATFPAVLNGKIVGSLVAPEGAEANLVSMKDDQVGLEFNGGGAWLPADQTDLITRVRSSH